MEQQEPTLSRRRYVAGAAAAATVAMAGCSDVLGGGSSGPETAVQEYVTALDEGDVEAINARIHPDGEVEQIGEESASLLQGISASLESSELVEEGDEMAIVRATITAEAFGETETTEGDFELRRYEGEWKIWSEASG